MLVRLLLATTWVSELVSELYRVTTDLPHVLFIGAHAQSVTSGHWIKVIALLWCVAQIYCSMKSSVVGPILYLCSVAAGSMQGATIVAPLSLHFGSHLAGIINSYTHFFSLKSQAMGNTSSFIFPFSTRLTATAFEKFE